MSKLMLILIIRMLRFVNGREDKGSGRQGGNEKRRRGKLTEMQRI